MGSFINPCGDQRPDCRFLEWIDVCSRLSREVGRGNDIAAERGVLYVLERPVRAKL